MADRAGRGRHRMTSLPLLSVAGGHSGTVHRRTGLAHDRNTAPEVARHGARPRIAVTVVTPANPGPSVGSALLWRHGYANSP